MVEKVKIINDRGNCVKTVFKTHLGKYLASGWKKVEQVAKEKVEVEEKLLDLKSVKAEELKLICEELELEYTNADEVRAVLAKEHAEYMKDYLEE